MAEKKRLDKMNVCLCLSDINNCANLAMKGFTEILNTSFVYIPLHFFVLTCDPILDV